MSALIEYGIKLYRVCSPSYKFDYEWWLNIKSTYGGLDEWWLNIKSTYGGLDEWLNIKSTYGGLDVIWGNCEREKAPRQEIAKERRHPDKKLRTCSNSGNIFIKSSNQSDVTRSRFSRNSCMTNAPSSFIKYFGFQKWRPLKGLFKQLVCSQSIS